MNQPKNHFQKTDKFLLKFSSCSARQPHNVFENDFFSDSSGMVKKKGFALLVSIIVTSILLIISFVVINIALKELIITSTSNASQIAFYAADSGVECAEYWDLKNGSVSAFDVSNLSGHVTCNGQTVTTGSETVPTNPTTPSIVGGPTSATNGSLFSITVASPVNSGTMCAIVQVVKSGTQTTINSKGYNTCNTSAARRFERGITISY